MANRSQREPAPFMAEIRSWSELGSALLLGSTELVSLVGGGGKTSAAFALATHRPGRRIVTTTTKMGSDRTDGLPVLIQPSDDDVRRTLDLNPAVVIWDAVADHRALGVEPETCDRWLTMADTVAVEADGSRRRPFKAPANYEPVIPAATTTLVACVGLAALNAPIREGCHRPERVADVAACTPEDLLTPERLVRVLMSHNGSRRGQPATARFSVIVNRCTPERRSLAVEIAERLADTDPTVRTVVVDEGAAS